LWALWHTAIKSQVKYRQNQIQKTHKKGKINTKRGKKMTFAEKLKSLRKGKGLTQMKLAAATNMSLGVIADIESGRREPSKEVAKHLAEFFDVPIQTFILEETPVNEPTDIDKILLIVDIMSRYLQSKGYEITPERRNYLVKWFYEKNLTDPDGINDMLSAICGMPKEKQALEI
jgi:transcriptional regulator with XRE-family HTH domain